MLIKITSTVFFFSLWLAFGAAFSNADAKVKITGIPYVIEQSTDHGSISIDEKDNVLIKPIKGTDFFMDTTGTERVSKVPYLSFFPKGDFIFSVKISATFNSAYDGGAILVIADDQNWGKLLFELFESGRNGVASTIAKSAGDDAYHGTRESNSQYLKVVRYDSSYVFYSSPDGENWNFLRHFSLDSDKDVELALAAQSPFSDELSVRFSDINFRQKKFSDFWQGK